MLTLRPYQSALMQQARERIAATGKRRILIQASTGAGKTVLIAQMLANASTKSRRAWFCCHRNELLEQSIATFRDAADLTVGVVAAGYAPNPDAPVQVCSVPSLARRLSTLTPPERMEPDEARFARIPGWRGIVLDNKGET